jgi:tetratricopeptide (TPR) repeat protein
VLEYLKKQTEGNVFFLVEVVRSLAESAGGLDMIVSGNIPESLTTDSMAEIVRRRLNRVPAEWWPLMEVAAVAGRQVDVDLLQLAMPGTDVPEWLRVGSDCVVLELADGQWRFAHDKLREAILASFTPEKSRTLHEHVARAIEAAHEGGTLPSSRLAYHWGHAGNLEREQHYAARAGTEMLQGAAYAGAIAHLERALALLPQISQDYAAQELPLQLELGTAYLVTRGHASPDMKRAFDRAGELCVALGDPSQLFRVLFGQATFYLFRGELDACREFAERCVTHAANSKDPDMLLEAHFALGNALYWQGEFAGAMEQANLVIQQFQPYQHEVHTAHFGHNPRITCLTYGAWSSWALGFPDRSLRMCHEALELAEKFDHGFSRAIGLQTLLFAYNQRRDVAETRRCAELLLEKAGDYPTYWIAGRFLLGWALIHQNAVQDGTEIIRDAWNRWQQAGAGLAYPLHTTFLIEATIQSGEWAEGLKLAEDALAHARKYSERSHEAELCRLRGELIWKSSGDREQALAAFREAVEVARRQQALSYELRALNSICSLGLDPDARQQLATVFQRFTEGFDTHDLVTARKILEASQ